jgi:signal transduction histidine kinase
MTRSETHFPISNVKNQLRIWSQVIQPQLPNLKKNVAAICTYGFTRTLRNVIEHAKTATEVTLCCSQGANICLSIEDNGTGISHGFNKDFTFDSDIQSLSKMFDRFIVESGEVRVTFELDNYIVEPVAPRNGTLFVMEIAHDSDRTTKEVFGDIQE